MIFNPLNWFSRPTHYPVRNKQAVVTSSHRRSTPDVTKTENLYRAAESSKDRTSLRVYVQDARYDMSEDIRTILVGKSRYFADNNPFFNKILEVIDAFVNGANGLKVVPANGKPRIDEIAHRCWDEWQNGCDFLGRLKFHYMTSIMLRLMEVDGECFVVFRECIGEPVQHKIQIFETHRCRSPQKAVGSSNIIDGIQYDAHGRVKGYYISDGLDGSAEPKFFPADRVIHVFAPTRAGQLRGIPASVPALTTMHDFEMIESAEINAAKVNSFKYAIVKTPEGEVDAETVSAAMARGLLNKNKDGKENEEPIIRHPIDEQSHRMLEEQYGGSIFFTKAGTEWDQNPSERPSTIMQQFWTYQIEKICIAFNISKLLIFPQSLQGTTARADIAATEATFKSLFSVMEDVVLKCYEWALSGYASKFPINSSFLAANVIPPRTLTADVGKESAKDLSEHSAGITTLQDLCGAEGKDWKVVLQQRAEAAAYAEKIKTEYEVEDVRLIYNPLNAGKANAPQSPGAQNDNLTQGKETKGNNNNV